MARKLFQDNKLIHAVVNCDYKAVKQILASSDYDTDCLKDIGGFSKDVPVFLLSKCYDICFNPDTYAELNEYKRYGISELDLRPQYAVIELRSFYEIKKYCELGANPDCEFPEHGSPIEYVDSDIAALYVDVRGRLKRQQKECFDIYDIVDLAWLARHQQNYDLLMSYIS